MIFLWKIKQLSLIVQYLIVINIESYKMSNFDEDSLFFDDEDYDILADDDVYSDEFPFEAEDAFALFGVDLFLEDDDLEDDEIYDFIESHGVWR